MITIYGVKTTKCTVDTNKLYKQIKKYTFHTLLQSLKCSLQNLQ